MEATVHSRADLDDFLARAGDALIGNYARLPVAMAKGRGSRLWDTTGREFIDLFPGFGGGILGHANPELVAALTEQAQRLWHVGNTFHTEPQVELAERLNRHAFPGRAFFCHSGLEANEAAVKLARLRGLAEGKGGRWKTVSLIKSFHGRSLAMIAATGNPAVKEGFGPPVPGFTNVDPLDLGALERAIDGETCCVLMEPIQGEGGVNLYPPGHLRRIREICDERELTLVFDEVWTGCGRTGRWFGHQWEAGVTPDVMTLGKAVGGGLPVGVMFAKPEVAKLMVPGRHGCTLGGNPVCASVSRTVFDVIERDGLVARAERLGTAAMERLRTDPSIAGKVREVRGHGLFIGVDLREDPKDLVVRALDRGVVLNVTAKTVIRLAPALDIPEDDLHEGLTRVIAAIAEVPGGSTSTEPKGPKAGT